MEVLRRCPLAIAQRLVHCVIALSTAVLDRVTKTMSVAPLLMNNLDNSKQKTSNLLSPAPPPYSWSLLGKSEGPAPPPSSKISWSFDLAWSPRSGQKTEGCYTLLSDNSHVGARTRNRWSGSELPESVKPKPRLLQGRPALEQFATFSPRTNKLPVWCEPWNWTRVPDTRTAAFHPRPAISVVPGNGGSSWKHWTQASWPPRRAALVFVCKHGRYNVAAPAAVHSVEYCA